MAFYEEGLRFSCLSCGKCCRIKDGYVWLTFVDLEELSAALDLSKDDFRALYTGVVDKRVALKSFPNGDCIFYEPETGCRVYNARPIQCRTFPFWPEFLRGPETWEKAKRFCRGAGTGKLHTKQEIDKYLESMRDY